MLDLLMIDSCISRHNNPTPDRTTADTWRNTTKQKLTTRNIQTLLFSADEIVDMDSADSIHQRQNSKNLPEQKFT